MFVYIYIRFVKKKPKITISVREFVVIVCLLFNKDTHGWQIENYVSLNLAAGREFFSVHNAFKFRIFLRPNLQTNSSRYSAYFITAYSICSLIQRNLCVVGSECIGFTTCFLSFLFYRKRLFMFTRAHPILKYVPVANRTYNPVGAFFDFPGAGSPKRD